MQPYIDPLDLEPKISKSSLRDTMRQRETVPTLDGQSFDTVMQQQQVKQDPTPVWVPKPLSAQPDVKASVSKPTDPPPKPQPTEAVMASIAETEPIAPKPIEHNRPNSLREMLQPVKEEPVFPASSVSKPEAVIPVVSPDFEPEPTPVEPTPVVEPKDAPALLNTQYIIQDGDTLSGIVASQMKEMGMDFTTRELYSKVGEIARHNGMSNPDRIYVGNSLDLSPLNQHEDMIAQLPELNLRGMAASGKIATVTSDFGIREHPITNETKHHNGIDIRAAEGTPILPAKTGIVTFSGEQPGYGNMIEVDHGDGTQSRYAHLSELLAGFGDRVTPNQPLALSGATGNVTGPHLHFEYHQNGEPVDPEDHVDPSTLLGSRSSIAQQIR